MPLDAEGKPAKDGKIVLVSISMSNATQEFSHLQADRRRRPAEIARADDRRLCPGRPGDGRSGSIPKARPWAEADRRLTAAGVTPKQVQVAWIKLANVGPTGELTEHGKKLQDDTLAVLHNAKARFPNLRVAYLGSRIYAG